MVVEALPLLFVDERKIYCVVLRSSSQYLISIHRYSDKDSLLFRGKAKGCRVPGRVQGEL